MPCVKPDTLTGDEDPVPLIDPGVETAVNEDARPSPEPAVNATSTEPLPCVTLVPTSVATADVAEVGITPSCDQPADV